MHGRIPLIGCLLGLLVSTNGSYFFDTFTVPFVYNEVRDPTTEDLVSFKNALKLVSKGTGEAVEGGKIMSLFRKIDFVRVSYKAYYRTKKGNVCFVKWRLWATGTTSVAASSCDNSTEVAEGSKSEEGKEAIEATTAEGSESEVKEAIEATTADKLNEGNENGVERVTPSTNLNLFSASLGDEIDPVHTTRKHKGSHSLKLVKQDGDGNYLVPKKVDMIGFHSVAKEKPLLFTVSNIPNDIADHEESLELVNSGRGIFWGRGKRVSFNDDDRNTDLSQDSEALDDAADGSNVYGRPSGNATPGRRRKKVKMFLANRAWKTNNFDYSHTESYGEGWNRRSRYGQRSGRDNQSVRPVFVTVNRTISPKIHRIVKEPIKMNRRSKKKKY